jgi:hypothetical protein
MDYSDVKKSFVLLKKIAAAYSVSDCIAILMTVHILPEIKQYYFIC